MWIQKASHTVSYNPFVPDLCSSHCLNVLVCFTQRRGAAIGAVSGGDPYLRTDGFGETGGEEMSGVADAGTQTVPWCSTTVSDLVSEYYFLSVFRIILGTLAPFANVIWKLRILVLFCINKFWFCELALLGWRLVNRLFGGIVCLLPCD